MVYNTSEASSIAKGLFVVGGSCATVLGSADFAFPVLWSKESQDCNIVKLVSIKNLKVLRILPKRNKIIF